MRKLPYNNVENPYVAAQEFLWREELDQGFLDQVAQFITQNAQPITLGVDTQHQQQQFYDPFTGAHRYRPGQSEQHQPQPQPQRKPATQNFQDPFTGDFVCPKVVLTELSAL
jgi:phospholipase A-2-activating protein